MKTTPLNNISLYTPQAQPYIDHAAAELRVNAIAMIRELPEVMHISNKRIDAGQSLRLRQ